MPKSTPRGSANNHVNCTNCQTELTLKDVHLNQKNVVCPECSTIVRVSRPEAHSNVGNLTEVSARPLDFR